MDNMATYSTCDGYCDAVGLPCIGAWEEKGDTCTVSRTEDCQYDFGRETSDAICECGKFIFSSSLQWFQDKFTLILSQVYNGFKTSFP